MVNDRQSLDLTTFARARRRPRGGMADLRHAGALPRGRRVDGSAGGRYRRRAGARTGLAAGAPPALHLRHQRQGRRPARSPFSGLSTSGRGGQLTYHGPGQRVAYVDARPETAAARRAGLCRRPRAMDHPDAGGLQRPGRTPRGPRRRLGGPAGQGQRASRTRSRPSACGCGAGCRSTASRSMWSPT